MDDLQGSYGKGRDSEDQNDVVGSARQSQLMGIGKKFSSDSQMVEGCGDAHLLKNEVVFMIEVTHIDILLAHKMRQLGQRRAYAAFRVAVEL